MRMNDTERQWLNMAFRYGGGFLQTFADACFRADEENFYIMHPALDVLMEKYPEYHSKTLRTSTEKA